MFEDPIIKKVWATRDKMARDAAYDLHRFCQAIRKAQCEHPERLIKLPANKVVPTNIQPMESPRL